MWVNIIADTDPDMMAIIPSIHRIPKQPLFNTDNIADFKSSYG